MITFTVQELLFCAVTKFQTMVNTHSSLLLDQLLPKGTLCSRVEHYHEETSAGGAFLGEDYVLLIGQLVVQEVENREAPLFEGSLFRIQLQLLKASNCFLKTLNCGTFVTKISIHIRNFCKRSC